MSIGWRYIPSSDLGGDTIGYHSIDDEHLALYLIDVTGHGLDSSLLAVTMINVLRAGSLGGVDMRCPEDVLESLNNAFQAERHGDKFFTIWHGVYGTATRRLAWSGGGHHPSLLLGPDGAIARLGSSGPLMGAVEGMDYPAEETDVAPGSRLLVYSDGLFELLPGGVMSWSLGELDEFVEAHVGEGGSMMDRLLAEAERINQESQFDDDVSIIEATFV